MKPRTSRLLKAFSMAICTVPPAVVTLHFFPIWYEKDRFDIVLPAVAVLSFCLCAVPILKWVASKIKAPSAWMLWGIAFVLFFTLEKIVDQMVIITLVGAIGNILGALLWKIADNGGKVK